jgi:hypothetical protein
LLFFCRQQYRERASLWHHCFLLFKGDDTTLNAKSSTKIRHRIYEYMNLVRSNEVSAKDGRSRALGSKRCRCPFYPSSIFLAGEKREHFQLLTAMHIWFLAGQSQ